MQLNFGKIEILLDEIYGYSAVLDEYLKKHDETEDSRPAVWISAALRSKIDRIYAVFINLNNGGDIDEKYLQ